PIYVDECNKTPVLIETTDEDKEMGASLQTRIMNFYPEDFLKRQYNINNLEDVVLWYINSNKTISIRTLFRLINLSIRAYAPNYITNPSLSYLGHTFEESFIKMLTGIAQTWVKKYYYSKFSSKLVIENDVVIYEKKGSETTEDTAEIKKMKIKKLQSIVDQKFVNKA